MRPSDSIPMLLSALVTVCVLQSIEPKPDAIESGRTLEVRTFAADGNPLGGVPVFLAPNEYIEAEGRAEESDRRQAVGTTDASGRLQLEMPSPAGPYRLEAVIDGVHCVSPIHAIEPTVRWPFALLGGAVGAFVLWNCRDLFRRSRATV